MLAHNPHVDIRLFLSAPVVVLGRCLERKHLMILSGDVSSAATIVLINAVGTIKDGSGKTLDDGLLNIATKISSKLKTAIKGGQSLDDAYKLASKTKVDISHHVETK